MRQMKALKTAKAGSWPWDDVAMLVAHKAAGTALRCSLYLTCAAGCAHSRAPSSA